MIDEPRRTAAETPRGAYSQTGYGPPASAAAWQQHQPGRWALPSGLRRISWGAVIAGAAVALVVQLMLNLLGLGIGAVTVDPAAQQQAVPEGLGLGAALWWLGSVLIALFVGGWFAGYLAGTPERGDGAVHGLVTWSLATILSLWLLTTAAGAVMSGAWNVMQGGLQAMDGQAAAQQDGQQQQQPPGQGAQAQQQQQQQPMQQAQEAWQQAQEQGPEAAQQAADAVAWASFWTFAALLLGAVVAALGGLVGSPQDAPRTHRGYAYGGGDGHGEEARSEGYGPERAEREQRAEDQRVRQQREQVEREQEEYKHRPRP